MRWDVLARVAFVAVVAYCAVVLRPLEWGLIPNVAFGAVIAVVGLMAIFLL